MYFGERVKLKTKDKKDMAEVKSALGGSAKCMIQLNQSIKFN